MNQDKKDRAVPIGYQCIQRVSAGESLASIAEKYHVDIIDLRRANKALLVDVLEETQTQTQEEKNEILLFYPNVHARLVIPSRLVDANTLHFCTMELAQPTPPIPMKSKGSNEVSILLISKWWCTKTKFVLVY